jgi:secondary thiamine-phosphate synthase enzyme
MRQAAELLEVRTRGRGLVDFTDRARGWVRGQGMQTGLLTLFCRHTSASLLIQENADPDVLFDLEDFMKRTVSRDPRFYRHTTEGTDDMPSHIRAMLTAASLSIPFRNRRLVLGTWQGLYVFEHRDAPHRREVTVHLVGE